MYGLLYLEIEFDRMRTVINGQILYLLQSKVKNIISYLYSASTKTNVFSQNLIKIAINALTLYVCPPNGGT